MDPLTLMFITSILPTMFSAAVGNYQQKNEFGQQKELLSSEQDFQRERDDLAYQRSLPSTQYQNFLDAGFNPNLAAESVLAGNGQTVSSSSSPAAPTVNSAIDAITRSLNQGGQNMFDTMLKNAQIGNLEANTNKTDIEAGIIPRDFELRKLTVAEQIKVWDKSVEKMASEIGYNEEMTKLVKEQNLYYGRLSEAQIQAYQGQVFQAIATAMNQLESIQTQKHQQKNIDADTALKGANIGLVNAQTENVQQQTINLQIENEGNIIANARNKIAHDFEVSLGGVPLTADAQKMVNKWAKDGDYDQIKNFYTTIFQSSLNQELGSMQGEYRPFMNPNKRGVWVFDLKHGGLNRYDYKNFPLWNLHF